MGVGNYDYIDRGPDSAGVVAFLREFSKSHRVVALRGNDDQMMIDTVLDGDDGSNWAVNGAAATWTSYGLGRILDENAAPVDKLTQMVNALRSDPQVVDDAEWLAELPLSYQDEHRYFVHAGIRPGVPLDQQGAYDRIWIREDFLNSGRLHGKFVVHGHSPTRDGQPEIRCLVPAFGGADRL